MRLIYLLFAILVAVIGYAAATGTQINASTMIDYSYGVPGHTMTGPLAMGAQKITGVANGTDAQDAVTYSQLEEFNYSSELQIIYAGDYGVKCDGTTDDTAAVNLAIAAVNATVSNLNFDNVELRFPSGYCMVTPGELYGFYSSVYAPDTIFCSNEAESSNSDYVLKVRQYHHKRFVIGGVRSYQAYLNPTDIANNASFVSAGTGIWIVGNSAGEGGIRHVDYNDFVVGEVIGFVYGMNFDGITNLIHIASNTVHIKFLIGNTYGLYLSSNQYQNEASRYLIDYAVSNERSIMTTGAWIDGGIYYTQNNLFEIQACELHADRVSNQVSWYGNGNYTRGNTLILNSLYYDASSVYVFILAGSGAGSGPTDNTIIMPPVSLVNISLSSFGLRNVVRFSYPAASSLSGMTDCYAPSVIYTKSIPTTGGRWSVGSVAWHNDAASGEPMGWQCTVAGSPGTWTAMANLA